MRFAPLWLASHSKPAAFRPPGACRYRKERGMTGGMMLYCSFCGKSQDEALCLVAGPTVFICDNCTRTADDIVFEHRVAQAVKRLLPALAAGSGTAETSETSAQCEASQ